MRQGLLVIGLFIVCGCGQQSTEPQTSAPGGSNPIAQIATPEAKAPNSNQPKVGGTTAPSPGMPARNPAVSTGSPVPTGMPTAPPPSNLPASKAIPASVKIAGGTSTSTMPSGAYRQREVSTSNSSDGSCGWKISSEMSAWAKSNFDSEFLKQHAVEAILSITEEEVKAWKVDGSPHPDFEGFIRLKLQSNDKISFPMRFKKKTRVIVVKIPQRMQRGNSQSSLNVNLQTNDSGYGNLYELSNGDLGGSEYRFQYVAVSAPKDAKFASIPATINISSSTQPITLKAGQKFTVAGQSFEITAVRPFQKSDVNEGYGGYMGQQKLFTTVVVKGPTDMRASLHGSLITGNRMGYDPYMRTKIDDKGNIVQEKVDPQRGYSGMMQSPMLQAMGGNPSTGERYLIANVNQKFVTSASFMSSASIEATLENIPLEK